MNPNLFGGIMKRKFHLTSLFFIFSILLLSKLSAFERKTDFESKFSERLYVTPYDVSVTNKGIFVTYEGLLYLITGLHVDQNGIYFDSYDNPQAVEAWNCYNCYAQNTGSRPKKCRNCGEMNY
jgi:hypothetical protein